MTNPVLAEVLSLAVPSGATKDRNLNDLEKLMSNYAIAQQARDDFLAQLITFDEYLKFNQ